jgi:hypothetical protein
MFGWMILFALLSLAGELTALLGTVPAEPAMRATALVFITLLLAAMLTRLVRGNT